MKEYHAQGLKKRKWMKKKWIKSKKWVKKRFPFLFSERWAKQRKIIKKRIMVTQMKDGKIKALKKMQAPYSTQWREYCRKQVGPEACAATHKCHFCPKMKICHPSWAVVKAMQVKKIMTMKARYSSKWRKYCRKQTGPDACIATHKCHFCPKKKICHPSWQQVRKFQGIKNQGSTTNGQHKWHHMWHHKWHHGFLLWSISLILLLVLLICCKRCFCRPRYDVIALHQAYEGLHDDDAALDRALALSLAESSSVTSVKPIDVPLVPGAPNPPPGVTFGSGNQV